MQAGLTDNPLSFRDIFGQSSSSRRLAAVVRIPIRNALEGSIKAGLQLAA